MKDERGEKGRWVDGVTRRKSPRRPVPASPRLHPQPPIFLMIDMSVSCVIFETLLII